MNQVHAYREIYEQFVDEAAFLWVLRSIVIDQPHYSQEEIFDLEHRIDAQLDGLMTSPDLAWALCRQALQLQEPGEVFTAAVVGFRSHDAGKIETAVMAGLENDDTFHALVSAMGWLPARLVHSWIEKFFASKDFNHKLLALAACRERKENPAQHLTRIVRRQDCKQDAKLYSQALKIIGEFKRYDLEAELVIASSSSDEEIRFWALRSRLLLGDKKAMEQFESFVFTPGPQQFEAINIAFRILPVEQARNWISRLSREQEQSRLVIKSTALLGDPHAVDWLITMMDKPALARLAGEAFSSITGIDLQQRQLNRHSPLNLDAQLQDEIDNPNVIVDEDENLPWPDTEKIKSIWKLHGNRFVPGKRYFLGKEISQETLKITLINARQRQRHSAMVELALMMPAVPLLNTRARMV